MSALSVIVLLLLTMVGGSLAITNDACKHAAKLISTNSSTYTSWVAKAGGRRRISDSEDRSIDREC